MQYLALPRARNLRGRVRVPPSKSATNRAFLLAALSREPVEIVGPLVSDDTRAIAACLAAMGARFDEVAGGIRVSGPVGRTGEGREETPLDARDSGTAARFLAAVVAAAPGRWRLDGSPRLRERPMAGLLAALREAGAEIACPGREGFLPLAIRGGTLSSGAVTVDASPSSQFVSALLLAAVAVDGGLTVEPKGTPVSAPYVEATLEILAAFGHETSRDGGRLAVRRGSRTPTRYVVPGDESSALPILAAVGASGGEVTALGVSTASRGADARALPVLARVGIGLEDVSGGLRASFAGAAPAPVSVEASEFPDAVPALAALAALAPGESRFDGVAHLRGKESDRLAALETLIAAAGGAARAEEGALVVSGGLRGSGLARLPTASDHRIAMAAAVLAIARGGCLVENPDCVAKSYPNFFRDLASLLP